MYLNYNSINLDADGSPIQPVLKLQNLGGKTHGILSNVKDLVLNINFAELSEISFSVPRSVDGETNRLYDQISGYKVVHTDKYGVYLLTTPETTGSGLEEIKNIKGYSIEKTFERKKFFLPEGTYALYSSNDKTNTIVAFIEELDSAWEIRHVDESLKGRYRTFDRYDGDALSFMYGTMMEKYRCLVVFDPYKDETGKRGIHLYDADADVKMSHIYLSYDNLLKETTVTELSDELVTKLNVYGADNLSIRDVNPTGQDYIVNLDHFINTGDIGVELGKKVTSWQNSIAEKRNEYTTLVALKAGANSRKLSLEAEKIDMRGQLDKLILEQSAIFQKIALDPTYDKDDASHPLNIELSAKNEDIDKKEEDLAGLSSEIKLAQDSADSYMSQISNIISSLKFDSYSEFTESDRQILDQYMIEDTITEETFVATSYETNADSFFGNFGSSILKISNIDSFIETAVSDTKTVFSVKGGELSLVGSTNIEDIGAPKTVSADIIDLIIERTRTGASVSQTDILISARTGNTQIGDAVYSGGNITVMMPSILTSLPNFDTGIFSVQTGNLTAYFTSEATEYEKYAVQNELYDHGLTILSEQAFPFYEFTIESGNFIFSQEFEKFKDKLALGKGVYLMLGSHGRVTAPLIGVNLDFSDITSLGLTFSNRFQKSDGKARLKELLEKSYSSSRNFDASQYAYKETSKQMSFVSEYLKSSLDAAKNNILAASDQSVNISGAGITLTSSNPDYAPYQMRLVNNMLAITNDNWQTASLAVGLMPLPASEGENLMGMVVNADVIAGKLLIGENLIIESQAADGEPVQFRFNEDGAYLRNAKLLSENSSGTTQIAIDPEVGIVMGTSGVVTEDDDGNIVVDNTKANFYFDSNGNLNLAGNITWDNTSNPVKVLYARTALSPPTSSYDNYPTYGSSTSTSWHKTFDSDYDSYASYSYSGGKVRTWTEAVQIRGTDATVTDDVLWGLLTDNSKKVGIFNGGEDENGNTKLFINATRINGGLLSGCSIGIGANSSSSNGYNFYVDESGNVTLNGNITWGSSNGPVKVLYSATQSQTEPNKAYSSYDDDQNDAWHTKLYTNDLYASYSYSGGTAGSWTAPIKIRGEDGKSAEVTDEALFDLLTDEGNTVGIFNSKIINGKTKLFINATYIDTDTLVASKISTINSNNYGLLIDDGVMRFFSSSQDNSIGHMGAATYLDTQGEETDSTLSIYGQNMISIVSGTGSGGAIELSSGEIRLCSRENGGGTDAYIVIDATNEVINIRGNIYINGELVYEL